MNGMHNTLNAFDLIRVFLRSLLIQASWSFDRMQSYGFAYALEPALKKLYPDQREYESRRKLHLEYFNTQPYFASFILGAVLKREQDRASGRSAEDVSGLKASLMAPLGAMGDSFFWGALKPMASVAAVAVILTGFWWGPLLFLAIFNAWHVGLRISMLFWGYASGGDAVALLAAYPFTKMAKRFKLISLCLLGGILGVMPLWRPEFSPAINVPASAAMLSGLALVYTLVLMLRRGGSPVNLMLGLAILCLVLAYAGVV
jgi:mannose PTS system EIID component